MYRASAQLLLLLLKLSVVRSTSPSSHRWPIFLQQRTGRMGAVCLSSAPDGGRRSESKHLLMSVLVMRNLASCFRQWYGWSSGLVVFIDGNVAGGSYPPSTELSSMALIIACSWLQLGYYPMLPAQADDNTTAEDVINEQGGGHRSGQ